MSTKFAGESRLDSYLIQDSRTYCGNDVLWWMPKGDGYTTKVEDAGVYTKAEAQGKRVTDIAWPIEIVKPLAHLVVDMQKLPKV